MIPKKRSEAWEVVAKIFEFFGLDILSEAAKSISDESEHWDVILRGNHRTIVTSHK